MGRPVGPFVGMAAFCCFRVAFFLICRRCLCLADLLRGEHCADEPLGAGLRCGADQLLALTAMSMVGFGSVYTVLN